MTGMQPLIASSIRMMLAVSVAAGSALLAGCGSDANGTYVGVPGQSVFDRIDLQSGGKVVVTLVGVDYPATYEVSGKKVVVNNGSQLHELKIDHGGCLVDAIGGTYCRRGDAPSGGGAAAAAR